MTAGGGSGGHVTPVVAVLAELHNQHPDAELRFWCDRKFARQARGIMHHYDPSLKVETIFSGKLRRYHNLPIWRQLLRPVTIVGPNLRDMLLVAIGTLQSVVKLIVWRPDVVFTKGGFVCLPIGVAAHVLRIPLVIHDSDAHPGLTNRILSRWATSIATGAPLKYYPYPPEISHYVGIPIRTGLKAPSEAYRNELKATLGFDENRPLVVVTGGGLGAQRLNDATAACLARLVETTSVALISGVGQYESLRQRLGDDTLSFQLHAFVARNMTDYLAAADIVVARAGMTTILELAALARPTILVPNGYLTGGHQLKNAAVYADADAVEVLDEHQFELTPEVLGDAIEALLHDSARRQQLGQNLAKFARPQAAQEVADLVLKAANHPNNRK